MFGEMFGEERAGVERGVEEPLAPVSVYRSRSLTDPPLGESMNRPDSGLIGHKKDSLIQEQICERAGTVVAHDRGGKNFLPSIL